MCFVDSSPFLVIVGRINFINFYISTPLGCHLFLFTFLREYLFNAYMGVL